MKRFAHSGLHLMANLHEVDLGLTLMTRVDHCQHFCRKVVSDAGLTIVGESFYGFGQGQGVTGALVLAESHLTIHTWPESRYVTLDVFVCNYQEDNSDKASRVFEAVIAAFSPGHVDRFEVQRA
ncbi:adenosylmethionine decarboxylase [Methylophilus glucosoxydans]|uniref:Adenosylmethionine decarboxylase n=1 Tax=Methylophilus glucosoxydans TaxID=752553 RepID=A0ABW3GE96_9PROT